MIHVAPNGIEVAAYEQHTQANPPEPKQRQVGFILLFTGKMDYRPNIDAVL
jgi:hypothetical protein